MTEPVPVASSALHVHCGIRNLLVMAIVAVLTTAISVAAVQRVGDVFQLSGRLAEIGPGNISSQDQQALNLAYSGQARKNAMVKVALVGAITGMVFGVVLGGLRRTRLGMFVGGACGLLFPSILGSVAGFLAVAQYELCKAGLRGTDSIPEERMMLMHAITWGLVGVGIGLVCGLSTVRTRAVAVISSLFRGGLLGMVGGAGYSVLCGMVAPMANTSLPLPEPGVAQWVWIGLPSLLLAVGLAGLETAGTPRADGSTGSESPPDQKT